MARVWPSFFCGLLLGLTACSTGGGKVVKVLPHWLDDQGRHALSASLYKRDSYQAQLRDHPDQRHGLRYDIHWRAPRTGHPDYRLRLELRTEETPDDQPLVIEQAVKPPLPWGRWTGLSLTDEAFAQAGEIIAWRVSLWNRDQLLSEVKSFLW